MDVNVQGIVDRLAKTIGDLHVRVALLETQIETMMEGGGNDATVRPPGKDYGDVERQGDSRPCSGTGTNGKDEA